MEIMNKFCFVRHINPVSEHKFKNSYEGTSGGMNASGVLSSCNHFLRTAVFITQSLLVMGTARCTKGWL
jgi:hypothetical protein